MEIDGGVEATSGLSGNTTSMPDSSRETQLLDQLNAGDRSVLSELFEIYRERLKVMVRLRMDRRIVGRVSPSDILQETVLEATRRIDAYLEKPNMPFHLWIRFLAGQQLLTAHRRHLGTKRRNAAQEISIFGGTPQASSEYIAAQLVGHLTSPSQAVVRDEMAEKLQQALSQMDPIDREILTLRHVEEFSNNEVAQLLELKKSAASNRYVRALQRLRSILSKVDGMSDAGR